MFVVYPSMNDYYECVQNPKLALQDSDLKNCKVATTPLGLPIVASGGFALTYRLYLDSRSWAVKCFHKEVADLQARYSQISAFLKRHRSKYFVDFEYLQKGIQVKKKFYPIIKMDWVEGQDFNSFIDKNVNNKTLLQNLSQQFLACVNHLEALNISHGDLQHGNILICNNQLKLIDYDGCFVPGMSYSRSNELGHVNYQHPLRTEFHFGSNLDRFSSITIFLALEALKEAPHLWAKYDNGDNLLFKRGDYNDPEKSPLIKDLQNISALRAYVDNYLKICRTSFEHVPRLNDFIKGKANVPLNNVVELGHIRQVRRQYPLLNGADSAKILYELGNVAEIVGKVTSVHVKKDINKDPLYAFIDFGDHSCIVLWSESIVQLKEKGFDVESYNNKWIDVIGLITTHHSRPLRPQIVLENASKLRIISDTEAKFILQGKDTEYNQGHQTVSTNREIIESLMDPSSTSDKRSKVTSIPPLATQVITTRQTKNQVIVNDIKKVSGVAASNRNRQTVSQNTVNSYQSSQTNSNGNNYNNNCNNNCNNKISNNEDLFGMLVKLIESFFT